MEIFALWLAVTHESYRRWHSSGRSRANQISKIHFHSATYYPVNLARSGMIDTHIKIRHSYDMISATPIPPYYAVIFTSLRTEGDDGYESMAKRMLELAQKQPGFLGMESVRDQSGLGITISYWESIESVSIWKSHHEHREAQRLGREKWYSQFKVRICKVERDYAF